MEGLLPTGPTPSSLTTMLYTFYLFLTWSCTICRPLVLLLYATGAEVVTWPSLPWPSLLGAATMSLGERHDEMVT